MSNTKTNDSLLEKSQFLNINANIIDFQPLKKSCQLSNQENLDAKSIHVFEKDSIGANDDFLDRIFSNANLFKPISETKQQQAITENTKIKEPESQQEQIKEETFDMTKGMIFGYYSKENNAFIRPEEMPKQNQSNVDDMFKFVGEISKQLQEKKVKNEFQELQKIEEDDKEESSKRKSPANQCKQ